MSKRSLTNAFDLCSLTSLGISNFYAADIIWQICFLYIIAEPKHNLCKNGYPG